MKVSKTFLKALQGTKKVVLLSKADMVHAQLHQPLVQKVHKAVSRLTKMPYNQVYDRAFTIHSKSSPAGTIFKTPKGNVVALERDYFKKLPKAGKRNLLAHEFFHAKIPVLGHSEILAHLYGGLKSKAPVFNQFGPVDRVSQLLLTRPARTALELSIVAPVMIAKKVIKKLKEPKQDEKNELTEIAKAFQKRAFISKALTSPSAKKFYTGFITGGIGGNVATALTYPLDTFQVRSQAGLPKPRTAKEIYKGLGQKLSKNFIHTGIQMGIVGGLSNVLGASKLFRTGATAKAAKPFHIRVKRLV